MVKTKFEMVEPGGRFRFPPGPEEEVPPGRWWVKVGDRKCRKMVDGEVQPAIRRCNRHDEVLVEDEDERLTRDRLKEKMRLRAARISTEAGDYADTPLRALRELANDFGWYELADELGDIEGLCKRLRKSTPHVERCGIPTSKR